MYQRWNVWLKFMPLYAELWMHKAKTRDIFVWSTSYPKSTTVQHTCCGNHRSEQNRNECCATSVRDSRSITIITLKNYFFIINRIMERKIHAHLIMSCVNYGIMGIWHKVTGHAEWRMEKNENNNASSRYYNLW